MDGVAVNAYHSKHAKHAGRKPEIGTRAERWASE